MSDTRRKNINWQLSVNPGGLVSNGEAIPHYLDRIAENTRKPHKRRKAKQ